MTLPEQIRKQSEAVQEFYKQLDAEKTESTAEENANAVVSSEENTADENTAVDMSTPVVNDEQAAGSTESTPEDDPNSETYAQKWRTLQGMYNAEVPRLRQQNRELLQRVQQLEQLLATLTTQSNGSAAVEPQVQAQTQQPTRFVTEKDIEEYGESIDVMRRVTREEMAAVLQRLAAVEQVLQQMQTNVVPQVQTIAQRQQISAEQQFWADLAAAVPNFREINDNEAFQKWLLEPDPLTGITRQTYLEDAQRNLDAHRVVNIFRAWLETTGQTHTARSVGRASGSELERQVAPGRSRNTGVPTSTKGRIYTPDDIRAFFNDVRAGKYKGREQERDRIERDIFAAQREGRIVM